MSDNIERISPELAAAFEEHYHQLRNPPPPAEIPITERPDGLSKTAGIAERPPPGQERGK